MPVVLSTEYTIIELESWFAAKRKSSSGVKAKFLGISPLVENVFIPSIAPVNWSIFAKKMLLCPLFEPYKNFPFFWTWISAVVLIPENDAGTVEMVLIGVKVPFDL